MIELPESIGVNALVPQDIGSDENPYFPALSTATQNEEVGHEIEVMVLPGSRSPCELQAAVDGLEEANRSPLLSPATHRTDELSVQEIEVREFPESIDVVVQLLPL